MKVPRRRQVGSAHLAEVQAQCVGVIAPGDLQLCLAASTRACDLRTAGERERRLLRDQLRIIHTIIKHPDHTNTSKLVLNAFIKMREKCVIYTERKKILRLFH